jgi:16S rRNA (cytosine967-C5)-methyltransferase
VRGCAKQGRVSLPVQRVLELGLVQMLFMDRIPDHAAVDLAVRGARRLGLNKQTGLINGILRRVGREKALWLERIENSERGLLMGPAPKPVYQRWQTRYGAKQAANLQRILGCPAVVDVRIDRGSLESWQTELAAKAIDGTPARLELPSGAPQSMPGFESGDWTVQDRNAARVVPLLPAGGRCVVDLCAAPGGKTTQLAALQDNADLTAIELHEHRAGLVRQALVRCGRKGRVVVGDARQLVGELGPFDRMVLDAPCSGLGTLRRHPEIGTRQRLSELVKNSQLQSELLAAALRSLSVGGYLVYSVCSLEPEEGEAVVANALLDASIRLVDHPELAGGQGCFGLDGDGDGFYVALLEKKG